MKSFTFPAIMVWLLVLFFGADASYAARYPANVTEIIRGYGYPCEDHSTVTADGFILSIQRIPHGRTSPNKPPGPVVFLQHGLLDSSVAWTLNPPYESLAFILADQGYDVWLGNNRGSLYALQNTKYNTSDPRFWDWSFDEMALYDFPAQINYVLQKTGAPSLSYIAHSQGTMQAFAGFQLHPEVIPYVNLYVALAPMAFLGNIKSLLLRTLADLGTEEILSLLGYTEFYPSSSEILRELLPEICGYTPVLCTDLFGLLFGYSTNLNLTRTSYYGHYEPNPTSVKNILHISQLITSGKWQMFDYGSTENVKKYNSTTPPQYSLSAFPQSIPIGLFYGGMDDLADTADVQIMISQLPNSFPYPPYIKFEPLYAHFDPVLDMEAYLKIYPDILTLLRTHSVSPKQRVLVF